MLAWAKNRQRRRIVDSVAPLPETPTVQDIYTALNIKVKHPPPLNEGLPLSLFQHALSASQRAIEQFKRSSRADQTSHAFRWRHELVHRAQRMLLQCMYYVAHSLGDAVMLSRDYRNRLAPGDHAELGGTYSERILFTAQALSRGFQVRSICELQAFHMLESANVLKSAYHTAIAAFYSRTCWSILPPYDDLAPVLRDFELAWVNFEERATAALFEADYGGMPEIEDDTDLVFIQMKEATDHGVRGGVISIEQLQESDPSVLVGIPRLTIICALRHQRGSSLFEGLCDDFRWFKRHAAIIKELRDSIQSMSAATVRDLELQCVGSTAESGELDETLQHAFRLVCQIADELQTGSRAKEIVRVLAHISELYNS
ncbi:hypothetical protein BC831DRAFT_447700 [Entophlyctis helioformis]|nr:hypothetical protein BC831DRAFT_447700 [Entophlyctis helioformis]